MVLRITIKFTDSRTAGCFLSLLGIEQQIILTLVPILTLMPISFRRLVPECFSPRGIRGTVPLQLLEFSDLAEMERLFPPWSHQRGQPV